MKTIQFTGERMIPQYNKGELIYLEHISRYYFAKQFIKNKIVLDIACGSGYGTNYLFQSGAKKVIGIDISNETIAYCQRKYKNKNISFLQGNIEKPLPFSTNEFDVIVSMETIEHLHNQKSFLNECKRILKKNGILIISTPNALVYPKGNKFHINEFTPKEFKKILLRYFKYVELFYQNNIISNYIMDSEKKTFLTDEKLSTESELKNLCLFRLNPLKNLYQIAVASNSHLPFIHQTQTSLDEKLLIKMEKRIVELQLQMIQSSKTLQKIYDSRGWKIISFLHNIRIKIPILKNI